MPCQAEIISFHDVFYSKLCGRYARPHLRQGVPRAAPLGTRARRPNMPVPYTGHSSYAAGDSRASAAGARPRPSPDIRGPTKKRGRRRKPGRSERNREYVGNDCVKAIHRSYGDAGYVLTQVQGAVPPMAHYELPLATGAGSRERQRARCLRRPRTGRRVLAAVKHLIPVAQVLATRLRHESGFGDFCREQKSQPRRLAGGIVPRLARRIFIPPAGGIPPSITYKSIPSRSS